MTYSQDTLQEKIVFTKDTCQELTSYQEKLINGVFYQRDLLYNIYQIDNKLLDIKDSRIKEYQNLDTLQQHKTDSLYKVISNKDDIIVNKDIIIKKERRRKIWSVIGFSAALGAINGLFIYRELTR